MNKYLDSMKKNYLYGILIILIIASIILAYFLYKEKKEYTIATQNQYNFALYELIDYVQNLENYLAITSTPEHGAETLTKVWREANLAQVYLAQLPISSNELSNTSKFLNQVSEYSYSLSRKNIYNEELSQEDLNNLKELHGYSKELKNTLDQLATDMNERKNKLEGAYKRYKNCICTTG